MSKQRYVTLGVALCAALGVHAFVLFYTMQPAIKQADISPIQIDLLPQLTPIQEQVVKMKDSVQQKTTTPTVTTVKTLKVAKHEPVKQGIDAPVRIKETEPAPTPEAVPEQEERKVVQEKPQTVPNPIQQSILAAIVYPRQAQRRGWEGSAKFSLDIQQEMIQKVTLLVSTGYKALDNAAQKGIASIDSLPLSDGKHILPVSFHLQ